MKSCENCVYREGCDLSDGEVCSDYREGDPTELAEIETDIHDFIGDESEEDFFDHEDFEFDQDDYDEQEE